MWLRSQDLLVGRMDEALINSNSKDFVLGFRSENHQSKIYIAIWWAETMQGAEEENWEATASF